MENIYVMSDIHGQYKAFTKMLDLINLKEDDTLYILGDVIDRGDYNLDIIDYIKGEKNIIYLKGNHEEMMCEAYKSNDFKGWFENGGISTYKELMDLLSNSRSYYLTYLDNLPLYKIVEVNNIQYLLVHAGLIPLKGFSLEETINIQKNNLLWIRRNFLKSKLETDYKIIFGHTKVSSLKYYVPLNEENLKRSENCNIVHFNNKIAIDCGCADKAKLGCLRLNDMKEYYVDCI